jgi:AraC-like DNA-binding protein
MSAPMSPTMSPSLSPKMSSSLPPIPTAKVHSTPIRLQDSFSFHTYHLLEGHRSMTGNFCYDTTEIKYSEFELAVLQGEIILKAFLNLRKFQLPIETVAKASNLSVETVKKIGRLFKRTYFFPTEGTLSLKISHAVRLLENRNEILQYIAQLKIQGLW